MQLFLLHLESNSLISNPLTTFDLNKMKNVQNLSFWSVWYVLFLSIHSSFLPLFSSSGSTHCGRPEHRPQSKSQPLLKSKHWKWLHELPAITVESAIDGKETDSTEADPGAETAASPAAADAGGCGKTFSYDLLHVPAGPTERVHYFPFLFAALCCAYLRDSKKGVLSLREVNSIHVKCFKGKFKKINKYLIYQLLDSWKVGHLS